MRRAHRAAQLNARFHRLVAPPGGDLQRRIVDRAVEDDHPRIDLQRLAVSAEGSVHCVQAAVGAQLTVLRGRDIDQAGHLAVQAVGAHREVAAEVEAQLERERQFRLPLGRRQPVLAEDHDVVAEGRQAIALEFEVAAVGAQLALERHALAVIGKLAIARSHQAHVRAIEDPELVRAPS